MAPHPAAAMHLKTIPDAGAHIDNERAISSLILLTSILGKLNSVVRPAGLQTYQAIRFQASILAAPP